MGITKGEEKENQEQSLYKVIVAENIANLRKEMDVHVQESQRIQIKMTSNKSTPSIFMIKLSKDKVKGKIWKRAGEKQLVT